MIKANMPVFLLVSEVARRSRAQLLRSCSPWSATWECESVAEIYAERKLLTVKYRWLTWRKTIKPGY